MNYPVVLFFIVLLLMILEGSSQQDINEKTNTAVTKDFYHTRLTDNEVHLKWKSPLRNKNDETWNYRVSVKRIGLIACVDYGKKTDREEIDQVVNVTEAIFRYLKPYAIYVTSVKVENVKSNEPEYHHSFVTKVSEMPTSSYSNLRFDYYKNQLKWERPENCETISGPVKSARLIIAGVGPGARRQSYDEKVINQYYFDLNKLDLTPRAMYRVRLHVERNEITNNQIYQMITWTSRPTELPALKNLTIFESDVKNKSISIRFEEPDEYYGEIESYEIIISQNNNFTNKWNVQMSEKIHCELWQKYICIYIKLPSNINDNISTELQISAKSKILTKFCNSSRIEFVPHNYYYQDPGEPSYLEEIYLGNGIVKLRWIHPLKSTKVDKFYIKITPRESRLRKKSASNSSLIISYPVIKNEKIYSEDLNLNTSTTYEISMKSCYGEKSSQLVEKIISVPDGFDFIDYREIAYSTINKTLIRLNIPPIINATINSTVNVIVNGRLTCIEDGPRFNRRKLIAAVYNTKETKGETVIIGTNQTNAENLNCNLYSGETYEIRIIIVNDLNESSNFTREILINLGEFDFHLLWLAAIPIMAIIIVVLIIWRNFRGCRTFYRQRRNESGCSPVLKSDEGTRSILACFTPKSRMQLSSDLNKRISSHIYAAPYESDSRVVRAEYFSEYVKNAAKSGLLISQYITLPRDLTRPCEYGKLPINMPKNRKNDLIAYDDWRVVLRKISDDPHSDYINANYIQGNCGQKAYIATQGPLPNTVNDFWRMIWQEKVGVICMLTNVVEKKVTKCEKYWPDIGLSVKYGEITVSNEKHQTFADYVIRHFEIRCQKYKRQITQLHYTEWPDNKIPRYYQSLVSYLKKLNELKSGDSGPIVVHCSNGVGRTGTLILCDICLRQGLDEGAIDVVAATIQMRDSRVNMVGSKQQYILAHVVIAEAMASGSTQLSCDDRLLKNIKKLKRQLPSDMKRLDDTSWHEEILYSVVNSGSPNPRDFFKKKSATLDSASPDVVHFERCSQSDGDDIQYITAIGVDGFESKKQYLASQLPTTSTWLKFWKLIEKKNIELVIILQYPDADDSSSHNIVPNLQSFSPYPNLIIENNGAYCEEGFYTIEELSIKDTSKNENKNPRTVKMLTCAGWEEGKNGKPPSPSVLVSLWEASRKIIRKEGQSLVLCHDGVHGCGLYLALSFLLEKMSLERECDVISAVRAVRRFRQDFVKTEEQFEYLYEAAIEYAECFKNYANFTL